MVTHEELTNAAIGAVVTILTSFVPFSPILGGAVAGYLHGRDGPKVGAISGAIAAIPFVGFGLLFVFFFGGIGLFGGLDALAFGVFVLLFVIVALVFAVAITVVLSGAGGWIGIYVLEETDLGRTPALTPTSGDDATPGQTNANDATAQRANEDDATTDRIPETENDEP
jgi:uncharacterized membrane protein YbhN (UPF0104 family)